MTDKCNFSKHVNFMADMPGKMKLLKSQKVRIRPSVKDSHASISSQCLATLRSTFMLT